MKKDLRGTWPQALFTFLAPLVLLFSVRWLLIEPFVIPSGSMIPTLLEHDHIFVNKLAYGVHVPFSSSWAWQWSHPKRGEVMVFRYPKSPDVFFIKRVVGVAGDEIALHEGVLYINGEKQEQEAILFPGAEEGFEYFQENGHVVRYINRVNAEYGPIHVPEGNFFVMGDNRDQSSDSRVWGFVPEANLVGRALWIWLSCDQMLQSSSLFCDPQTIRWNRLLKSVK